ncbi:hypothetical protein SFA35_05360 [Pseudomonas sp. HR96]|uniref:hypothetical protein n=1 Tax=Pseudomonas sp. HR96 TaxID=1027966 RepID=UPI002A75F104|nr:hypothetical protein [Pseudomonas sp. HR96]WPP00803.1 hypothetical protein SFA35_05360 [Pseudomonas sp. HR96]
MRWVFLLLWLTVFGAFNLLLFMAMAPGTPWLLTAFNLAAIALLILWFYGYFTSGRRRYRGFAVAGGLFILIVALDMLCRGLQAWNDDSCEVFFSRRRLGLFQELLRMVQEQHQCQALGGCCAVLGVGLMLASVYLFWVQLVRLRLKPLCS